MKQIPYDPVILLSYINTQLRDFFPSLDAFCDDHEVEEEVIIERLGAIDYWYNKELNQFK